MTRAGSVAALEMTPLESRSIDIRMYPLRSSKRHARWYIGSDDPYVRERENIRSEGTQPLP